MVDMGSVPGGGGSDLGGFFGGIGGGIISAGGSIGGALINSAAQGAANETNIQMNREQMAFQERMSSSAYQRAAYDMKAAGLNPMAAYQQGGASSPSGSAAQVASTAEGDALKAGVASAMDTARLYKELEVADSQKKLNDAASVEKATSAALNETTAKGVEISNQTQQAELPAKKAQAKVSEATADFDRGAVKYDGFVKRVGSALGLVGSAFGAVSPLRNIIKGGSAAKDAYNGKGSAYKQGVLNERNRNKNK